MGKCEAARFFPTPFLSDFAAPIWRWAFVARVHRCSKAYSPGPVTFGEGCTGEAWRNLLITLALFPMVTPHLGVRV